MYKRQIFKFPDDESQLYIKRVIGLPGDKVQIIDGKVYINDSETPLDEPYLPEPPEGDYGPYYVPEDSYFMLGDNRNWSKDSRFWTNTYVKKEKVLTTSQALNLLRQRGYLIKDEPSPVS